MIAPNLSLNNRTAFFDVGFYFPWPSSEVSSHLTFSLRGFRVLVVLVRLEVAQA